MHILVTGAAGFIGFHLARRLIRDGHNVIGLDNLSDYYDVNLKKARLARLAALRGPGRFHFEHADMADAAALADAFKRHPISHAVNLAAQAGVRHSLVNPASYIQANLTGFANLLEQCRGARIEHLVFASSSSVYGLNAALPYDEGQNVDHPLSLYAATKKSNELLAHSYSHLYGLAATGLRFFTVYGPWGRPDMALYIFTEAILRQKPLRLFNNGQLMRDFTYVDDIIEGVCRVLFTPAAPDPAFDAERPDPAASPAPWRIYNIGNNAPVPLAEFVAALEQALGKRACIEYLPMQPGDTLMTAANVDALAAATGFRPHTSLAAGIKKYVEWHLDYYGYKSA